MVEIADIKDEDSLKAWLNGQPRATSVQVAYRSAMRVLPIWWQWTYRESARERDLTTLPVLRCCLIAGVAGTMPTQAIATAATTAALATANVGAGAARTAANVVVIAVTAITNVAANVAAHGAATAATAAANAAAAAAHWRSVRADCALVLDGRDVLAAPLWQGETNPLDATWRTVKQSATAPEWRFWLEWYQAALDGTPQDWKLLERIALIDNQVWNAGPEAVAEKIAEIEHEFAGKEASDGFETTPGQALSRNAQVVGLQIDALKLFLEQEIETLRGRNDASQTEAPRIAARIDLLTAIIASVDRIREAFENVQADPHTALVAVADNLPAIVDGADQLAEQDAAPVVSGTIITMAASIKHLTDNGAPGYMATPVAAVDTIILQPLRKWLKRDKKK